MKLIKTIVSANWRYHLLSQKKRPVPKALPSVLVIRSLTIIVVS